MATATPNRSIFRGQALQKYRQNQEKSVLPRFIAPSAFLFFWMLLIILMSAGIISWLGQIPLYVTGSGVVLDKTPLPHQSSDDATAVILLTAIDAAHVHAGLSSQVQIGSTGLQLTRVVSAVSPAILSPNEAHKLYGITMTDPALVISLSLGPTISRKIYAGSPVHVQIQIGSRRLISLFPFFSSLQNEA